MVGLLVQDTTGCRVTGHWYRIRQVAGLLVTGTGYDSWQGYWLLVQDTTGGSVTDRE